VHASAKKKDVTAWQNWVTPVSYLLIPESQCGLLSLHVAVTMAAICHTPDLRHILYFSTEQCYGIQNV